MIDLSSIKNTRLRRAIEAALRVADTEIDNRNAIHRRAFEDEKDVTPLLAEYEHAKTLLACAEETDDGSA